MTEDRPPELVSCPECGEVASIEWSLARNEVVYLKIRCIARHWFLMPADTITSYGSQDPYLAAHRDAANAETTR